jgi:hypothetical protein
MGMTRLTILFAAVVAVSVTGCGSDAAGISGSSGTGGTGGTAGSGPDDPCVGSAACVICGPEALPQVVTAFLPDGIRVPIEITATPAGDVVQGQTASIEISAEAVLSIPPTETLINGGSTAFFVATSGGTGTVELMIPEQTLEGENPVVDVGTGSADFSIDAEATELVIKFDAVLIDISILTPVEVDVTLDVSDDGLCSLEGDGVIIPVQAAP